jgi:enoyl-[acyl-carrier protein] reductase III
VTRYPMEVLDPGANLEEDLGIDSVKLGEVFAVLREKYDLPEKMDLPREKLQTIGGVAEALFDYVALHKTPLPAVELRGPAPAAPNGNGNGSYAPSVVEESFAALTPERKPFAGKVALVTGSGRGLGKDIVSYIAELGASVVVNSFHSRQEGDRTVEEIKAKGGSAVHAWGSVANPEHVKTIFDAVEENYGGLDFFISNASNGMLARLKEITPEHWEKGFRTNVVGLHQSALRAVEMMKRRGGGKIITLSTPASHGYVDYFGCMGAVKAAVESLTKSMAIEFAPDNIQVNCVSPGPVYGDLLNKWPESERLIRQWEGNTAYERLCEARDVSHFIAYLLSDPVKLFTGSVLIMDGGISSQGW